MTTKPPIDILKGLLRLTPEKLEQKLKEQEAEFFHLGKWNEKSKEVGIFIDLSQLRWVNLGAATQLVLLIESAKKTKIQVYLALPLKRLTNDEKASTDFDPLVRENIRKKREQVNSFLKVIQFDRAIKCEHIWNSHDVKITEQFEFGPKNKPTDIDSFNKAFQNEYKVLKSTSDYSIYNYKYILPLTWLNTEEGFINSVEFEKKFEEILMDEKRGISNIDVLSLKNVVISELLKNVKDHAGEETKYALISIGLMSSKTLVSIKDDELISYSNLIEHEYLKWIYENSIESFVEIYIGDSGTGVISDELLEAYNTGHEDKINLVSKVNKLKLLKWAFNKWSTRRKNEELRGTKGLYRINRIINKYNGIFLIRNNELCGGYQKGGYSNSNWIDNSRESYFTYPGTLIQLKLCPYKEVIKFNFSFQKIKDNRSWKTITFEFSKTNKLTFENWIRKEAKTESNLLLIIKSVDEKIDFEAEKDFLEKSLKLLSHYRHPNGIVVYIADEIGKETLQGIAESTNELILREVKNLQRQESKSPDHENVYDPVLILEKGNSIFWFGGDQKIIDILNELYKSKNNKIKDIDSFKNLSEEDQNEILIHFQNDDSLVVISKNDEIEFNFTNIQGLFRDRIREHLLIKNADKETSNNNLRAIATPKLKMVDVWHDIKAVMKSNEAIGYALAMNLKIIEELGEIKFPSRSTHILIDHNQQKELAVEFAKLIGIDQRNIINISDDIDFNIPRRTPLFNKDEEVFILTTIVSSSETIRRLVKYVRRDIAIPKCIICLANYREYDITKLHTWGKDTPIISIYQHNNDNKGKIKIEKNIEYYKKLQEELNKCTEFISPDYETEKPIDKIEIGNDIMLSKELREHFIDTKSLHYNHIGKYNGRHFTFYIDKSKILKQAKFIWKEYLNIMKDWIKLYQVDKLILIKQEFAKDGGEVLESCINFLKSELPIADIVTWNSDKPIKINGKNIVYIDFGSLTGRSINKLLGSIKNTDNILLSILFSQFQNGELDFYKRIKTIKVKKENPINNTIYYQKSLFDEIEGKNTSNEIIENESATVQINFIYNLPLNYYNSTTCPICEHERVLDYFKIDDEYMNQFVNDRKRKLKIRDRKESGSYPCDYYLTVNDNNFELSSILIMEMYEIKRLMEKATESTQYRISLFNYIFNIFNELDNEINNPDSKLYALLYLISYEVNLLQKEPLVFQDFREIISELSLIVATTEIKDLVEKFEKLNKNKISPFKLAVRYKFAAITALRSSRKLKFCNNISNIIFSSTYETELSNNLAQNTFYHIISLHKNQHNQSIEYFQTIDNQITKINESSLNLTIEQQLTLSKISSSNKRILKKMNLSDKISDCQIIINLKKEIKEHYEGISHPDPIEHFTSLDFYQLDRFMSDFEKNREDSVYYINYKNIQVNLIQDWEIVSNYIERVVHVHLAKLSDKMFESKIFRNYYILDDIIKSFDEGSLIGDNDRFTELIYLISQDLNNLFINYDEYISLYNNIYNHIIKEKSVRRGEKDSTLIKFLSNFPTNIISEIENVFPSTEFPKIEIIHHEEVGEFNVFYPKNQFSKYLRLIKKNIVRRLNPGLNISDVMIKFMIDRSNTDNFKTVSLHILYDSTDQWDDVPHNNGSFKEFKDDLTKFDGDIEKYLLDDAGIFNIYMRFVKYE